jgi:hypothetical protein
MPESLETYINRLNFVGIIRFFNFQEGDPAGGWVWRGLIGSSWGRTWHNSANVPNRIAARWEGVRIFETDAEMIDYMLAGGDIYRATTLEAMRIAEEMLGITFEIPEFSQDVRTLLHEFAHIVLGLNGPIVESWVEAATGELSAHRTSTVNTYDPRWLTPWYNEMGFKDFFADSTRNETLMEAMGQASVSQYISPQTLQWVLGAIRDTANNLELRAAMLSAGWVTEAELGQLPQVMDVAFAPDGSASDRAWAAGVANRIGEWAIAQPRINPYAFVADADVIRMEQAEVAIRQTYVAQVQTEPPLDPEVVQPQPQTPLEPVILPTEPRPVVRWPGMGD